MKNSTENKKDAEYKSIVEPSRSTATTPTVDSVHASGFAEGGSVTIDKVQK